MLFYDPKPTHPGNPIKFCKSLASDPRDCKAEGSESNEVHSWNIPNNPEGLRGSSARPVSTGLPKLGDRCSP